jgi:Na+-transporting NADH:ubiquinone oxidoreductase subunit B
MSLRSFLDDIAPSFEKGGKFEALYPAYEAIDTALYTPSSTTAGASHVRDGLNLKRVMITVWLCAFIPVFAGSYFIGLNANEAMQAMGLTSVDSWRGIFLNGLVGFDPNSVWDCLHTRTGLLRTAVHHGVLSRYRVRNLVRLEARTRSQ